MQVDPYPVPRREHGTGVLSGTHVGAAHEGHEHFVRHRGKHFMTMRRTGRAAKRRWTAFGPNRVNTDNVRIGFGSWTTWMMQCHGKASCPSGRKERMQGHGQNQKSTAGENYRGRDM